MNVDGYRHFGGKYGESAAIKNLLAFAGVRRPDGAPLSETLCFGIAGGIGAGYAFCPSVPRHGTGSGVSVVGRHKAYDAGGAWYRDFFERIGAKTRITETTGKDKAYQNLLAEIQAGRPAVVWCSQTRLPFLRELATPCDLSMHSFVVYGIDEEKRLAHGGDRAPSGVTLSLDDLAAARDGICSHKNRTLTFEPPKNLTAAVLKKAVSEGIQACAKELLAGKMKTYSLPGLEIWAKMITNDKNKDGWLKVFQSNGLLYLALRDCYDSIETAGTGGGLYRGMYADFLQEAAAILKNPALADLAAEYRELAAEWTALADAILPDGIAPLRKTRELLVAKSRTYELQGDQAAQSLAAKSLLGLEAKMKADFPLRGDAAKELVSQLRARILQLHERECRAAERLQQV